MTNGPVKRSDKPINPYPKGSARAKLWARKQADKKKPKKAPPKKEEKKDKTKRREYLDKMIDG